MTSLFNSIHLKNGLFKSLIILMLISGIVPSAKCQFNEIGLPEYPGGSTSFDNRLVDFGNPDQGFFCATVHYSPSSGEEYWFYTTEDGGMTWDLRFKYWSQWFSSYFLTAVNGDTCLAAYGHQMGDYLFGISRKGSVSHSYYGFPNWTERPLNVSIYNDNIQYYTAIDYGVNKATYSVLYILEGDTMFRILKTNRDTLDIFKSAFISQDTGFLLTKNASDNTFSVLKTTDGCHSLHVSFTTGSYIITDIDFFNASTGMISCTSGMLYKTTDAGLSWYPVSEGITETINCLDFVNDHEGYFGGDNGKFFHTTDQGESWTEILPIYGQDIVRLRMFGPGQGYLMFGNGSCYRYTENSSVASSPETKPVLVYPNPANNEITIEFPAGTAKEAEISLVKLTGEILYHSTHKEKQVMIVISNYTKGIYILNVRQGNQQWNEKLVLF